MPALAHVSAAASITCHHIDVRSFRLVVRLYLIPLVYKHKSRFLSLWIRRLISGRQRIGTWNQSHTSNIYGSFENESASKGVLILLILWSIRSDPLSTLSRSRMSDSMPHSQLLLMTTSLQPVSVLGIHGSIA
jgi:hypothetical protein